MSKKPHAIVTLPNTAVHRDTFGQDLVSLEEAAVGHEIFASDLEYDQRAHTELQETKLHPRELSFRQRLAARRAGTLMTKAEVRRSESFENKSRSFDVDEELDIAEAYRERVEQDLVDLRVAILQDSKDDLQAYSTVILHSMPRFQLTMYLEAASKDPGLTPVDWLTDYKGIPMPSRTPAEALAREAQMKEDDQRLLNFLQAHNAHIESRQQDPEFLEKADHYKEVWRRGVARGIKQGWLHPSAAGRAEALPDTQVFEGDHFSTTLRESSGYHRRGFKSIVVAQGSEDAIPHELDHALLTDYDPSHPSELQLPFVDEPLTDHAAEVFIGNTEPGKLDPSQGGYREEKDLLRWIIIYANNEGADLSMRELTLAYSAPAAEAQGRVDVIERKLKKGLGAFMPHLSGSSALHYFQNLIEQEKRNVKLHAAHTKKDKDGVRRTGLRGRALTAAATVRVREQLTDKYNDYKAAEFHERHSGEVPVTSSSRKVS